ncbi:Yip1 family protein [Ferrimonas senticii]|uniref:Yip1 family protein n=1 Tax=Ferrimonas senticii TaxID=394566 RepID=UPI00040850E7|nr:Yip1 family protein [Ferrimonas senticii]
MILNHLWGLYAHPRQEWRAIERNHEGISSSLTHILLVALIPPICCYFASVHIGWSIGAGDLIRLTPESAQFMAVGMYFALIAAVFALAYLTHWMAKTFGANPQFSQALEVAAYSSTPMFMMGLATLYPQLWFVMLAALVAISYSVYLLYSGVPIIMNIHEDRGFIYASSVVTCGLVLLVAVMAASVILWGHGFGPTYIS